MNELEINASFEQEDKTAVLSVLPKDPEQRKIFAGQVSSIIKMEEDIEVSKESIKDLIDHMWEVHKDLHPDDKKGEFTARVKGFVSEALKAKLTVDLTKAEEGLAEYDILKKDLA